MIKEIGGMKILRVTLRSACKPQSGAGQGQGQAGLKTPMEDWLFCKKMRVDGSPFVHVHMQS